MHCEGIWYLTHVYLYLEYKLAIELLLHYPSLSQGEIFLLKISTLPKIEPETAACKAMTLRLRHSGGELKISIIGMGTCLNNALI